MKAPTSQHPLKQRIRRIKTQHDDRGRINDELLYKETKKLQDKQINYAIYADNKSDELFPLKPVDINFIQSYTLKDDPKFKQIRHLLQKYNEQVTFFNLRKVLRYDEKSFPGLHLKTKVIDSMLKFMRLMFAAPDSSAKKMILDVAYYWFKKNIDSEKGKKKRTRESMEKQIRGILTQANVLPKQVIDKQLPSYKRQQQLYHYQINARTKYPQLNPPGVQLEDFVTHKLGFAHHQLNKTQNQHLNKSLQQLKEQKWKQRVIFKKPIIYQTSYDDMDGDLNNMLSEQMAINQGMKLEQKQQGSLRNGGDVNNSNNQQQPIDPNAAIVQNQQQQQQLDLGIPDQGDAAQQQPQPQQQDQKRGKLDPLVKIFLMDRQRRIKTQAQIKRQQTYTHGQNWKLQKNRIDQINSKFMTQWGGNRSRFKSQLSRKIQSIKAFTSISKAKQEAASLTAHPVRVENTIYKAKLNQTLKQYSSYLHHEPLRKDSINAEQSMSLYDKKRVKTQASSTLKHFSSVLQDNKRLNQKTQYLDEIQRLKQKFAKYKLYTPLQSFKNAIIHPQQKESNWAELDKQLSEGIQLPRSQMLSNPFFKVGKKKKKKGKKKN